jgi:hypothetical protein
MTQRYRPGAAHERMAAGDCPECGQPPETHPADPWSIDPASCDLTEAAVLARIERYREDQAVKDARRARSEAAREQRRGDFL